MSAKRTGYLVKFIYCSCIVLMGIYCYLKPFYNWDMLPYTALVLHMDGHSIEEAHSSTYTIAKEELPDKNYRQLTDSSNAYRDQMFKDANAFKQQLPFYVVKPLYSSLSFLFYKAGFSALQSTLLPGMIAYFLIAMLLLHWIGMYLRLPMAALLSLLILISSPVLDVVKTASPDCLSALFLFGSFYFIIEKPSLRPAVLLMVLSIVTRMDNIITCILISCLIYFSKRWYKPISLKTFLLTGALFVFCYLLIGLIAKQYGWSILFYDDFAGKLHPVYGSKEPFSPGSYSRLMYEHVLSGINHSYLVIFLALLVLYFSKTVSGSKYSFEQLFALLIPVILAIRFVLLPDISDRFYIAFYLLIIVLLVKKFSSNSNELRSAALIH